jgi:hypothetical protein
MNIKNKRQMLDLIDEAFYTEGFISGRMISGSKSAYREKYPENRVYFNANIFMLGEGKVWFGDLDLDRDADMLQRISSNLGKSLYILTEHSGRFENENLSDPEILKNAVSIINP